MKKLFIGADIVVFQYGAFFSCRQENNVTVNQYPMFWTHAAGYRPGMNFDSVCQVMNDIGMDGIMLNAPTPTTTALLFP